MFNEHEIMQEAVKSALLRIAKWLGAYETSSDPSIGEITIYDEKFLMKEAESFLEIVVSAIGSHDIPASLHRVGLDKLERIIVGLRKAEYEVSDSDIYEIITSARAIMKYKKQRSRRRQGLDLLQDGSHSKPPIALNCYDLDRLVQEVSELQEKEMEFHSDLRSRCRMLMRLASHCASSQGLSISEWKPDDYGYRLTIPLRVHRSLIDYWRLSLMDRILFRFTYNTNHGEGLTNEEMIESMRREIRQIDAELRKPLPPIELMQFINAITDISDSVFKHLYSTLQKLICVEQLNGKEAKYQRGAYAATSKGKRRYITRANGIPVCAMAIELSSPDLFTLHKEIGAIKMECYGDDPYSFYERYPLLSAIADIDKLYLEEDGSGLIYNDLGRYDIKTLNYTTYHYTRLYRQAEVAVKRGMPILLQEESGAIAYFPEKLISDGGEWSILLKTLATGNYRVVTPDQLETSWILSDKNNISDEESPNPTPLVIGSTPLHSPTPTVVTLGLTSAGMMKMKDSPFRLKIPRHFEIRRSNDNLMGKIKDDSWEGNKLSFPVLINDSFLDEVIKLDKCGHLVSMHPESFERAYCRYFLEKWEVDHTPYHERGVDKRLRDRNGERQNE